MAKGSFRLRRILAIVLIAAMVSGNAGAVYAAPVSDDASLPEDTAAVSDKSLQDKEVTDVSGSEDDKAPETVSETESESEETESSDTVSENAIGEPETSESTKKQTSEASAEDDVDSMPMATGYIDVPQDIESVHEMPEGAVEMLGAAPTESSYTTPNLPSLRNQNPYGSCWAHSSMSLGEINLIKKGKMSAPDLSEVHLAYFSYHTVTDPLGGLAGDSNTLTAENYLDGGGNVGFAQVILSSWTGAADESLAPYPKTKDRSYLPESPSDAAAFEDIAHLTDYYSVQYYNSSNKPDLGVIKTLIKETGAVSISFYAMDPKSGNNTGTYYNSTNNSYYNPSFSSVLPKDKSTNHAVTIVGWDDNFSKSKFNNKPSGDGAWLIRNSWTTGSSNSYYGYFWMSYYESSIGDTATAAEYDLADNYDNNYQYDGAVNTWQGYSSGKGANVFTAHAEDGTGGETLRAVAFASNNSNVTYKIDIYTNPANSNNPESGALECSVTGTTVYPGYHTIPLPQDVYMPAGTVFAVVVTLSKEGYSPEINAECSMGGWSVISPHGEAGQSFVYRGTSWADYGKTYNANLRIKAFTDNVLSPDMILPESIEFADGISDTGIKLGYGEEYRVTPTILPANATRKKLKWTSSNTSVATVYDGVIKGVKKGTAVITATAVYGGASASCTVTVADKVTEVSLGSSYSFNTIHVGESTKLTYSVKPVGASIDSISWTSSAPSILSVDDNGRITCHDVGSATITLTIDGKSATVRYDCAPAVPIPTLTVDDADIVTISWDPVDSAGFYEVKRGYSEERLIRIEADGRAKYSYSDATYKDVAGNTTEKYFVYAGKKGTDGVEYRTRSTTLNAYLGPSSRYTITYEVGDGTNTPSNPLSYRAGSSVTLLSPVPPEGYHFDDWYEDAGFTSKKNTISPAETGDKTFYARYLGNSYIVMYYSNATDASGNAMAPSSFIYGKEYKLTPNILLRPGYSFIGWNTEPDGSGTDYSDGQKVKDLISQNGGVFSLYAQWKPYTYKITFDANGGRLASTTWEVTNGKKYGDHGELPKPVREGYLFAGWYTEAYGGELITADSVVSLYKNSRIYAHWDEYSLKLDADIPTTAHKGDEIELAATLTPDNPEAGEVEWKLISGSEYASLTSTPADPETGDKSWTLNCTGIGTVTLRAYMSEMEELYADRIIDILRPVPKEMRIFSGENDVTGTEIDGTKSVIMHLRAVIGPEDADSNVAWSSTDDSVLRMDMTGDAYPLRPGVVTVRAVSVANPALSKTVKINVSGGVPDKIDINVSEEGAEADIGESIRLEANVFPALSSEDIIWTSSDESKATVDADGNVTALSGGEVVIYATSVLDASVNAEYKLTIRDISADEAQIAEASAVKLALGKSMTLKPADLLEDYDKTRDRIVWESDNASIAAVTSAGKVTGKSVGDVKIKLINETDGSIVVCPATIFAPVSRITLNAASLSLGTGNKTELFVTAIEPTMASNKVIWKSSAPSVAAVDEETGVVTALSAGKAVITAEGTDGSGKIAKCTVKVGDPVHDISLSGAKGANSVTVGKTLKLTASVNGHTSASGRKTNPINKSVRWEVVDRRSSGVIGLGNADINSKGVLTALDEGMVIIRAYSTTDTYPDKRDEYIMGEMELSIEPVKKDTTVGIALNKASATQNIKLNAGTSKVIRVSSVGKLATDEGIEWRITSGSEYVNISASTGDTVTVTGKKATPKNTYAIVEAVTVGTSSKGVHYKKICKITVGEEASAVKLMSGKNDVTGTSMDIALRKSVSLKAAVYGADPAIKAGNQNVIWRSSDTSVAAVSTKGKVTAVSNGEAVIYATSEDNKSVVGQVTVDVYTPVSKITLDKTKATLSSGSSYEGYTSSDNRYEILTPSLTPADVYGNMASRDELKIVTWIVSDPTKVSIAVTDTGSVGTEKSTAAKIRILSRLEYRDLTDADKAAGTSTVKTAPGQSLAIMAKGAGSVKITAVAAGGRKATCTFTIYTTARALDFTQTGGVAKDGEDYRVALSLTNKAYDKSVTLKPVIDYADAAYSSAKNDPLTKLYNSVKKLAVNSSVNYVSADPSVASVSAKGVITAKGKGETYITASTADGGHSRRIYVSVDKWEYGVFLNYEGDMKELEDYATVVIDAQGIDAADIAAFKAAGHKVYSYINIGALEEYRDYYDDYKDLGLGVYEHWEDEVWIDVTDPSWQKFILGDPSAAAGSDAYKGLAGRLADKGIDGYFVDNCDVYYAHGINGVKKPELLGGVADILKGLKATGLKVIINGGDCFMDAYCASGGTWNEVMDGINQETVFSKINWNKTDSFGKASAEDLEYFTDYVERYGSLGADIYLLEYTKDKKLVCDICAYCRKHGFRYYASPTLDLTV